MGPYLRTEEGQENAVLCNHDDELEDGPDRQLGPEFEVVTAPGTPPLGPEEPLCRELQDSAAGTETDISTGSETQVVYTREGVAVWPARKHRITGRLSLIRQNAVLFFAWLPYSQGVLDGDGPAAKDVTDVAVAPVSQGQYAVHPIPLSELKAIRRQTPKLGNHHLVLILKNGLTLPPFYFTSGGVRALFSVLKQHAVLTKSADNPGTYLVNDTDDPLQRSLATLDLSDVLLMDPAHLQMRAQARGAGEGGEAAAPMALVDRMREGVQRATQFARETTSSFLLPPKQQPTVPHGAARELRQDAGAETGVGLFEVVDRSESESMSSGLSHPCPPPLTQDEWFTFLDSSGRIVDGKALRMRIFSGGVEACIRKEAWKHLLGLYPEGSTAAYRQALAQKRAAEYERIKAQWTSISDKQAAKFGKWRERLTRVDKDVQRTDCGHPFFAGEGNPNVAVLRRILLTYSMYNFDLGYCQGMSDLASPILFVMRDEAAAFWAFAALMERLEANFSTDCTGMHRQLSALDALVGLLDPELHAALAAASCANFYFCYRWLLVHFKREFSFDEGLQLWEALWSCHSTPHLHLYLCVAVLRLHRSDVMAAAAAGFDDLLRFCIQLSGRLSLPRTLRCAERLVRAAGDAGAACIRAAEGP